MKLYNTIAMFDVYIVAESGEAAREALITGIAAGDLRPNEHIATETTREGSIRASWRDEKPLVAGDVSDRDFEKIKGRTTSEIFGLLYTKQRA